MSFRKRGEVLNSTGTPLVNNRIPSGLPQRTPVVPGRAPARPGVPGRPTNVVPIARQPGTAKRESTPEPEITNIGIRPSILTSQPTISTGSPDLDKILGHHGIPLGNSLLLEESGTTDFASILLRCFASQGIIHNRLENQKDLNCHVVVVGLSADWLKELPGLYKGSSKDRKKALVQSNESKVNVSNLSQSSQQRDLKIAWRYGLNKKAEEQNLSEVNENYSSQFDITERLRPLPSAQEVSFVQLSNDYKKIILNLHDIIRNQLKLNKNRTIRVVIPNLLIPSVYPPSLSQPTFIIPFIHSLRSLLKQYSSNLCLLMSLPVDLYPRSSTTTTLIENLCDSVIHLQPFNQAMSQLIEKAYKNEPAKIQHGLVNILKLPVLSERGLMTIHQGEYAFKNGRKKFEIEEWGIPVEDDANDNDSSNPSQPEKQTTKNIDF